MTEAYDDKTRIGHSTKGQRIWLFGGFMRFWGTTTTVLWALQAVFSVQSLVIDHYRLGSLILGSLSVCMTGWLHVMNLSYWSSVTLKADGRLVLRWRSLLSSHQSSYSNFRLARSDRVDKNLGLADHRLAMALEIVPCADPSLPSTFRTRPFYLHDHGDRRSLRHHAYHQLPAQAGALERVWQAVPAELRLERAARPTLPSKRHQLTLRKHAWIDGRPIYVDFFTVILFLTMLQDAFS